MISTILDIVSFFCVTTGLYGNYIETVQKWLVNGKNGSLLAGLPIGTRRSIYILVTGLLIGFGPLVLNFISETLRLFYDIASATINYISSGFSIDASAAYTDFGHRVIRCVATIAQSQPSVVFQVIVSCLAIAVVVIFVYSFLLIGLCVVAILFCMGLFLLDEPLRSVLGVVERYTFKRILLVCG